MRVALKDLKPNPFRDFNVDPIDEDNVEALKQSIKEDGFWGGIVARKSNGEIQIGAGHHRVRAAIAANVKEGDVYIGDFDDESMIRVYARENATQRNASGTATAGTVASAIRFIAKEALTGTSDKFIRCSDRSIESLRGRIEKGDGVGAESVTAFLHDVPGINRPAVQNQIANLKASGDYARIIGEVQAEIEREQAEAEKEQKRAEQEQKKAAAEKARKRAESLSKANTSAKKAKVKADERERTFDFQGVSKYLKNDSQVRTFRERVTKPDVREYLAVDEQAALAKELVRLAKENDRELCSAFINEHIHVMLGRVHRVHREITEREKLALHNRQLQARLDSYLDSWARHARGLESDGEKIVALMKEWPKGLPMAIKASHKEAARRLSTMSQILGKLF